MSSTLQRLLSHITFGVMYPSLNLYESMNIPVISTTRPLQFYRKTLFNNLPEETLAKELQAQTIIDIGCGLTPFIEDSMYQWCQRQGIDFYAVDPKVKNGFKFGTFDRIKSYATGAKTTPNPNIGGLDKTIASYANDLPLENQSVDIVISCWLIFSWLRSDAILKEVFKEFDRVLKPGGSIRIFPTPDLEQLNRKFPGLATQLESDGYEIKQKFFMTGNLASVPPSFATFFVKPTDITIPGEQ
ncbi:MAG: class I SAM-dependent methyltransferase [Pseudomonadales bacterium]|nr:class I SAM-dependent methyltransferase [Pseudomonadales bacterium]